jgi:hypothetical protein
MPRSLTQKQKDMYWNLSENLVIDCARACFKNHKSDDKYIVDYLYKHYSRYGIISSVFTQLLYLQEDWSTWQEENLLERVENHLKSTTLQQKKVGILSSYRIAC